MSTGCGTADAVIFCSPDDGNAPADGGKPFADDRGQVTIGKWSEKQHEIITAYFALRTAQADAEGRDLPRLTAVIREAAVSWARQELGDECPK